MWGTAVWNSRSMASVLHVHCQKGQFKSNCIALLYSSFSFWAVQGAEDKVPLCDQNVAAHPQHSTHDVDSISAQSRTLQPRYTLQPGPWESWPRSSPDTFPHTSVANWCNHSLSPPLARHGRRCRKWSSFSIILQTDPPLASLLTRLTLCQHRQV